MVSGFNPLDLGVRVGLGRLVFRGSKIVCLAKIEYFPSCSPGVWKNAPKTSLLNFEPIVGLAPLYLRWLSRWLKWRMKLLKSFKQYSLITFRKAFGRYGCSTFSLDLGRSKVYTFLTRTAKQLVTNSAL